jgi:hypothetical protein
MYRLRAIRMHEAACNHSKSRAGTMHIHTHTHYTHSYYHIPHDLASSVKMNDHVALSQLAAME